MQPQYYTDPYDANVDYVFLNTCGFISSGRDEAQHTIEKLLKKNKKIYMLGCALQYYKNIDKDSPSPLSQKNIYPLSRNDFNTITIQQLFKGYSSDKFNDFEFTESPRVYTNADYKFEYLKIAE
ncbi:TPA: hypothetical protein DEP21_01750 [Patescibacteria group bacterium]|nr:hypothetical protein [Candidatus Gracilibacteria bacterium]